MTHSSSMSVDLTDDTSIPHESDASSSVSCPINYGFGHPLSESILGHSTRFESSRVEYFLTRFGLCYVVLIIE